MSEPTFELGLVMAGAISAGAYSAGVLDFLAEALGQVERSRGREASPLGRARLRVVSGASAGGMCAGMLLGRLARQAEGVSEDPGERSANPLFDAWVNRIDIEHLLRTGDLAQSPADALPASLLDCGILDDIARDALRFPAEMPPLPAWVADELDLLLSVTNLRGAPYEIGFSNGNFPHGMLHHADWLHFQVRQGKAGPDPDAPPYASDWSGLPRADWLELLRRGCLATGAFPIALLPRNLSHSFAGGAEDLYSLRGWPRYRFWRDTSPTDNEADPPIPTGADTVFGRDRIHLPCRWPDGHTPRPYDFTCVDGGVMNNEPLELARRILTRGNGSLSPTGKETNRALILIDPFPGGETQAADYQPPKDILASGLAMFSALKNQARFKPQELVDAMDDGVFSRFVVAPTRKTENGELRGERAIACGSLGGFGGFLARDFRVHDYFLGRANCRRFLEKHFVLPTGHALFGEVYEQACREGKRVVMKAGQECLPIIPLLGTAAVDGPVPAFPRMTRRRLDDVMAWTGGRFDAVTGRVIEVATQDARFARALAYLVRNLKRRHALERIRATMEKELKAHGLY